MASIIQCKCGESIGTSAFPNAHVYAAISEESFDQVKDPFDRVKAQILFLSGRKLIECPRCGRFLVQTKNGRIIFYHKEEEG